MAWQPSNTQQWRRKVAAGTTIVMIVALALAARTAHAQELRGFRLGGALSVGQPYLSDASAHVWDGIGEFSAGAGLQMTLGYDARRIGGSVGLEAAATQVGGRDGAALTFAAVLHWRPESTLGGWRPVLTGGYVRQGLGSVDVAPRELPPAVFMSTADPSDASPRTLSLLGNGVRLGVGGEHALWSRAALIAEVTTDLLRFGSASYDGAEYPLHDTGWSASPRLGIGLRWWPLRR